MDIGARQEAQIENDSTPRERNREEGQYWRQRPCLPCPRDLLRISLFVANLTPTILFHVPVLFKTPSLGCRHSPWSNSCRSISQAETITNSRHRRNRQTREIALCITRKPVRVLHIFTPHFKVFLVYVFCTDAFTLGSARERQPRQC